MVHMLQDGAFAAVRCAQCSALERSQAPPSAPNRSRALPSAPKRPKRPQAPPSASKRPQAPPSAAKHSEALLLHLVQYIAGGSLVQTSAHTPVWSTYCGVVYTVQCGVCVAHVVACMLQSICCSGLYAAGLCRLSSVAHMLQSVSHAKVSRMLQGSVYSAM